MLLVERVDFAFSYAIIGGVLVGATWYLGRLALGPSGVCRTVVCL